MKEKATGFEALKGVGAPLKELIDKKGKSFSGFGELKDLGPGFQTLKSLTDRPDDKGKKPGPPKPIAEIKKEEGFSELKGLGLGFSTLKDLTDEQDGKDHKKDDGKGGKDNKDGKDGKDEKDNKDGKDKSDEQAEKKMIKKQ